MTVMARRLVDFFCGAGGLSAGYAEAGFEVVGVDIHPQPRYPFEFIRADALDMLRALVAGEFGPFDVAAASPPCEPVRDLLREWAAQGPQRVYVIENVPGAPLLNPIQLCGTSFLPRIGKFEVRRHRWFESNAPLLGMPCHHQGRALPVFGHNPPGRFYREHGHGIDLTARKVAMGVTWMNRDELAECVPPPFAKFIGDQIMHGMRWKAAA